MVVIAAFIETALLETLKGPCHGGKSRETQYEHMRDIYMIVFSKYDREEI